MEIFFWLTILGVSYSYAFYPLLLILLPKQPNMKSVAPEVWPNISIIITAHNEQTRIVNKLNNTLAIEYPDNKVEVLVASDCSTDETDSLVEQFADQGIKLVRAEQHLGKEYAQHCAIGESSGDILVFSDVATEIPVDAIKIMMGYFSDSKVGAVSSEDRFINAQGKTAGEGAYVKYEMWLRSMESRQAGLVGLSGSFFAARRDVCTNAWDTQSPSDFNTAMQSAKLGYVAVSCPDVHGYYKDLADEKKEYARKVRTVIRGITAIARHAEVLNPRQYGLFSFQVWSHKILRWCVPWFLLAAGISNLALIGTHWIYNLTAIGQLIFYALVVMVWRSKEKRHNPISKLAFFFVQVNVAIADATIKYYTGTRMTVWSPSSR